MYLYKIKKHNNKLKILFTLIFWLFLIINIQAQQSVNASGDEFTGVSGSLSYSIGQVVYTTNSEKTGSIAQGVQQAFEIFTLSNLEFTDLRLSVVMYPNPTTDKIILSIRNSDLVDLSYMLYELNGRILSSALVQEYETPIAIQNMPSGVYILKVNQNDTELQTFKIIKK